jgi:hypothetical protein
MLKYSKITVWAMYTLSIGYGVQIQSEEIFSNNLVSAKDLPSSSDLFFSGPDTIRNGKSRLSILWECRPCNPATRARDKSDLKIKKSCLKSLNIVARTIFKS